MVGDRRGGHRCRDRRHASLPPGSQRISYTAGRRTHDLADLASRLLPVYPQFSGQAEAVQHHSVWGIAYRYPSLEDVPEPLPEIEELERMIGTLTEFAAVVRRLIEEE